MIKKRLCFEPTVQQKAGSHGRKQMACRVPFGKGRFVSLNGRYDLRCLLFVTSCNLNVTSVSRYVKMLVISAMRILFLFYHIYYYLEAL